MAVDQQRAFLLQPVCWLLIALFVYTASSKLIDYADFRTTLAGSPLIGNKATLVAIALPVVECIAALLLTLPRTQRAGLYLSLALMVIFTAYVGYMILFASNLPCSCGGAFRWMTWKQHLVFNIVITLLTLWAALLEKRNQRQPGRLIQQGLYNP